MGQTVNLLSFDFGGSNPSAPTFIFPQYIFSQKEKRENSCYLGKKPYLCTAKLKWDKHMQENKKKAKYYLWPAATSAFIIAGIVFYYFFCTFSNSSEDKIVYIDCG